MPVNFPSYQTQILPNGLRVIAVSHHENPVISMRPPISHAGSRKNLLGDNPSPELVKLLSNELQVTPQTPPTFVWHTVDDNVVPVENSLDFAEAVFLLPTSVPGLLRASLPTFFLADLLVV